MKINIRRMEASDYEAVVALWQRAGLPFEPEGEGAERDSPKAIAHQLKHSRHLMLVAEVNGEITGVVFGSHDGRKGWINRLAVDPKYRRQGIAKRLIQEAEAALLKEGIHIFAALIEEGNKPSIELFKKLSYEERRDIVYFRKFSRH